MFLKLRDFGGFVVAQLLDSELQAAEKAEKAAEAARTAGFQR